MIIEAMIALALSQAAPPRIEPARGWTHGYGSRFPPQPTKEPPSAGRH